MVKGLLGSSLGERLPAAIIPLSWLTLSLTWVGDFQRRSRSENVPPEGLVVNFGMLPDMTLLSIEWIDLDPI